VTDTQAASTITDHWFEPSGAWYTRCRICHLAEASHRQTSLNPEQTPMEDRRDEEPLEARPEPLPVAEVDLSVAEEHMVKPDWAGVMCPTCSNEMVRTGTCYSCPGCGDTTGCG